MQMVGDGNAGRRTVAAYGGDDLFWLTHTGATQALQKGEKLDAEDFAPANQGRNAKRARKPPAVVSAIRSAIARAAWGKLSADERKARQQRVWAKRKAAQVKVPK
jgi:hypothetical protein